MSVYPSDGTLAASAATAVTFRGAGPGELDGLSVVGSRSGRHPGRLRAHADGRGAIFEPDRPFAPGERVTVEPGMDVAGADGDSSAFEVARKPPGPPPRFDEAKPEVRDGVQAFRSRPDLRPPDIVVKTASERAAPGSIFVAPKRGATQQGPMIVGADGEVVWFRPLPGDMQAFDFRAQSYEGEPVLTWWEGRMATYRGYGAAKVLDASYRPIATVRSANGYDMDAHEVKLTPDGTMLVMSYFVVPWDLSDLGGRRDGLLEDNVVQEIDVDTGELLFEWHALGTVPLGESIRPAPKKRGQVHDPWHLNSIDKDADGDLLLSARHMNAIYKIDRATGEVVWRLGGKKSDFEMGPGTKFALQHDARFHSGGMVSLFDNVAEDLPARGRRSRGLILELDENEMTASVAQEYEHPDGLLSTTQGSMQRLDGGGAFVGWGGLQPVFSEFDADGQTVFDGRFGAKGVESYRAYRMPWRADPPGRPRAAAAPGRVHVSWNGATDVDSWRVRPADGRPVTARRTGFETTIRVPGRTGRAVVEALDVSREVVGTSRPVRLRP